MIEFDMIADENTMAAMSREYDEVLRRNKLMDGISQYNHTESNISRSQKHSPHCYGLKCADGDLKERKLFENIYYLEKDMIALIKHLHSIAPMGARDAIDSLIKIKRRDSHMILKCYYNVTDDMMEYSPTISHDRNYCRLLRYIISNQQRLLVMLGESHRYCAYIKRVISNELTAGYILNSMAIYCRQ